jgi:hypothetical protein
MFKKFQNPIEEKLDVEITTLLARMAADTDKTTEEYTKKIESFEKLYELRHKSRISKDAIATIIAHSIGILAVINHERLHVIATKTLGMVKKVF